VTTDPINGVRIVRQVRAVPRQLGRVEQRNLVCKLEIAIQTAKIGTARFRACRDQAMVFLMLRAGLRTSEVSALALADLSLDDRSGAVAESTPNPLRSI